MVTGRKESAHRSPFIERGALGEVELPYLLNHCNGPCVVVFLLSIWCHVLPGQHVADLAYKH